MKPNASSRGNVNDFGARGHRPQPARARMKLFAYLNGRPGEDWDARHATRLVTSYLQRNFACAA
jgi:hypothetical protein